MSTSKQFDIIDIGNKRHRLTVTTNRVTIKIKEGSSESERNDVIKFLTDVSERDEMKNCSMSFRGKCIVAVNGEPLAIDMWNDRKTVVHSYENY